MIKVEDYEVTVAGTIPDVVRDINMLIGSLESNLSKEDYKHFKETLIWGFFETQCTQSEVIELMQGYERFRAFKESFWK